MNVTSLRDLYIAELQEIRSVEEQLVAARGLKLRHPLQELCISRDVVPGGQLELLLDLGERDIGLR